MDNMTQRLYGECAECGTNDLYTIREVPGNCVSSDNIAETDFDNRIITTPNFRNLPLWFRKRYGKTIDALKEYLFGHEAEVEAMREPKNEGQHAAFELDYLETLRENGEMLPYLVGLVTHNLRLKYGDKTGFSSRIVNYIGNKVRKYAEELEAIEPIVEEALDPAYACV